MHWAERIAGRLIENHPERQTFVCASGISPSGQVHIGNFREIVTTAFVAKALRKAGKEVRFIFSWDDFDRFRKVPANVDPGFVQYIGMPYAQVPCPYGCHASYAAHFEAEFERALGVFGIRPEFIYQSREYQSGRYYPEILHALRHREEIYDILMAFKTGESSAEDRAAYYPVNIYCRQCGKDSTTLHHFNDTAETVAYSCKCGHSETLSVTQADNMKLHWKIDWPMRWKLEQVDFEPGGRDHSSETGSYNVAAVISERIFGNTPPMYEPYEFISIKGSYSKMSGSSGHHYTPDDLLNIYAPENILFLFAKYQPGAAFHIGFDEDVLRNYAEFERYAAGYAAGTLSGDYAAALGLSLPSESARKAPSFSQIAGLLPLINFSRERLRGILAQAGEEPDEEQLLQTADRAEHWLRNWMPHKLVTFNSSPNLAYYHSLTAEELKWLRSLCGLLRSSKLNDQEQMTAVYAICHHEDKKTMRAQQKRLFTIIYQLVLNADEGPRLPMLIQAAGTEKMLLLLDL
ncbi:lysine--tRNA ligase [Paenibacillus sp. MMS20-IR301]|uniref:lysine--tRNA ligase n=1 Tax=Paenibacillus sp. MMS20-IR301 TaxID=2895946 RepID=UPI0028E72305|nr:lysine--tRNA ligase [Paenibacillus sp. MMS20-IR301]WNS45390.1 lysine--tRNA ligase [Paenibacillus sp. MMS20-IR301]